MSSEYIPVALKQLVFDRAKGVCEYCRCQARFAIDPLVIDHIQPVSRGGNTISENLALACQTCNNYKYTKLEAADPVTDQTVPLFHPRQMNWQEHFTWNEDGNPDDWHYTHWQGNDRPSTNKSRGCSQYAPGSCDHGIPSTRLNL